MTTHLISELSKIENIEIYNNNPELPIISFNIKDFDNGDLGSLLSNSFNIIAKSRPLLCSFSS